MTPGQNQISLLALVAKYRSGTLYAGWTAGGLPGMTPSEDGLAAPAKKALEAIKVSGVQLQTINLSNLSAFDFNYVGPIFDFSDISPSALTEDVMEIGLVDTVGAQTSLKFGEIQLLTAIANGILKWQFIPNYSVGEVAVKSAHNYSLLIPGRRGKVERDSLLIFKPQLPARGNEIEFTGFLREVIGRLIALDEQQPPELKKGYLTASSGGQKGSSIWDAIVAPTEDGEHFDPSKALLKVVGKLGLYDIRGLDVAEKTNLLREGLGKANIKTLVDISKAMLAHTSSRVN